MRQQLLPAKTRAQNLEEFFGLTVDKSAAAAILISNSLGWASIVAEQTLPCSSFRTAVIKSCIYKLREGLH